MRAFNCESFLSGFTQQTIVVRNRYNANWTYTCRYTIKRTHNKTQFATQHLRGLITYHTHTQMKCSFVTVVCILLPNCNYVNLIIGQTNERIDELPNVKVEWHMIIYTQKTFGINWTVSDHDHCAHEIEVFFKKKITTFQQKSSLWMRERERKR